MGRPSPGRGRLRGLARRVGISNAVKSASRALGYDLVRRHYYSAIPDTSALPERTWTRVSDMPGVRFDPESQLDFVERELGTHLSEYAPPRAPTGSPGDFYLDNGFYESVDAETLYAMVRRYSPRRIVELGSGMSTLVIAEARRRGGAAAESEHVVYDPYPRPELRAALERAAVLRPISATEVPMDELERLGAGDMLFVDTTHTVKIGSDVNRVVLDLLPTLRPGVMVHFHDIFIPWEYPREFIEERSFYWAEQYLLQAFLAFNSSFEILFSAHALQRRYPDRVSALIPSAAPDTRPSAFWLRRGA